MGIWDTYEQRVSVNGRSKRESLLHRERHMLSTKLPDSLSYHSVMIEEQAHEVAVINSDNLNEKTIISPHEDVIKSGRMVHWMNNFWLITECDANTEVYTKAKMKQCNHLLRWIDTDGLVHEQWCIIEDGTKYLTGEYEDRDFVVTRGDSRIAMTIARNEDTKRFNREYRFLIDDPDSNPKLSYMLTKPLKVGFVYNTSGVYSFVLQEVASTDDDNHELGVADYYKYFPKELVDDNADNNGSNTDSNSGQETQEPIVDESGKRVWF